MHTIRSIILCTLLQHLQVKYKIYTKMQLCKYFSLRINSNMHIRYMKTLSASSEGNRRYRKTLRETSGKLTSSLDDILP